MADSVAGVLSNPNQGADMEQFIEAKPIRAKLLIALVIVACGLFIVFARDLLEVLA